MGVDIAPFSAMPKEAEVLLLPGLPLMNRPGEKSEPGMWTFEVTTPDASVSSDGGPPAPMIDYVHPGKRECRSDCYNRCSRLSVCTSLDCY